MKYYNLFVFSVIFTLLLSCGSSSDEKEKIALEKEKIELEKKRLELEREKINVSNGSAANNSEEISEPKSDKNTTSVDQPSLREQENLIYNFYQDFDNAFDKKSMQSYIDNYYSASIKPTYIKNELPSYAFYNSKEHEIEDITLLGETNESRRFKVIFYFTFERTNGTSGSNKCADILTIDNNNIIIARSELGKVK